jgi:hypothetical protein
MEVGKIDCGAWLTLCPVEEKIGEVKLKILPIPSDFQLPKDADTKASIDAFAKFIVDWNLETDGVAIDCTDENKAKYLEYLVRMKVVAGEEGAEPEFAAVPIMRFAADIDNFLGN